MTNVELRKRLDQSQADRDLLIDELNDQVERRQMSDTQVVQVANELTRLLIIESDYLVMESILNFLGSAFARVGVIEESLRVVISLLNNIPDGCLIHAIPLIGASDRQDKRELIAQFLTSSNSPVRSIAERTLANY
jgi:hypothetical protein